MPDRSWIAPLLLCALVASAVGARESLELNGEWQRVMTLEGAVPPENAAWELVLVPSLETSNAVGGARYAWYRRSVLVPNSWAGQRVYLHLGGARYNPTVYVDGRRVGGQLDGWTPCDLEITDAVTPGQNADIIVRCRDWSATFPDGFALPADASGDLRRSSLIRGRLLAPIGGLFTAFGMWDDVRLTARPRQHLTDIAVVTSVRNAALTVRGTIGGGIGGRLSVSATVRDGETDVFAIPPGPVNRAGSWRLSRDWDEPRFWSPEDPHLYTLVLELRRGNTTVDTTTIRFGFRELWAEGPDVYFNGVKRHLLAGSGWPVARNQPRDEIRAAIRKMKAANCIAFRLHTQPWQKRWLEIADEEGLMIIEEGALWCDGAGGYALKDRRLWQNIKDHIAGMVRRDRNHASLVMWSIENEILHCGASRYDPRVEDKLADVGRFTKQLDPHHLITFEADLDPGGVADVIGLHYPHEMPDHTDYPNTADWLEDAVVTGVGGGLLGSRHKRFRWERDKPLYIGEYLWVPSGNFAPGTVFFGPAAYSDRQGYNRRAKALSWRYQTQAYRRAGVSGLCPWTFAGSGGHSDSADPLYREQRDAYVPVAAYPVNIDTRFFSGETLARRFDVFNDSPRHQDLRLRLHGAGIDVSVDLGEFAPATHRQVTLSVPLPDVAEPRELTLALELSGPLRTHHSTELSYSVHPKAGPALPAPVVIYRPRGDWRPPFDCRVLSAPDQLASIDAARELLVVAPGSFVRPAETGPAPCIGRKRGDRTALRDVLLRGGRILVLEQDTYVGTPFGVSLTPHASTIVFPASASDPALGGLQTDQLRFWRGDHYVSRQEFVRPSGNGARALLVSGSAQHLAHSPLIAIRVGPGTALLCQALVGEKLQREPAAAALFRALLDDLARVPTETAGTTPVLSRDADYAARLTALGVAVTNATRPGASPRGGGLLVIHGGGHTPDAVSRALQAWRPASVYWHAPDAASVRTLAPVLGCGGFTLTPSQGPLRLENGAIPAFRGVTAEELYFIGETPGTSWREPITPAGDIIETCLSPEGGTDGGDPLRVPVSRMTIEGKIVHPTDDGAAMVFATRGTATTPVTLPADGLYRVTLEAGGTPLANVYPHVRLSVDGKAGADVLLRGGDIASYSILARFPEGRSDLSLAFVNDKAGAGEDRNLILRAVTIDRQPLRTLGVDLLTLPPAAAVFRPREPGKPARLVVDTIRWDRAAPRNRDRAGRYASAVLGNLGAAFRAPPAEPEWVRPTHITPVGTIPYYRNDGKEIALVAAGTVRATFECIRGGAYTVVVRGRSQPAAGEFAAVAVTLDGEAVGSAVVPSPQAISVDVGTVTLPPGEHTVSVAYTNDLYRSGQDRNFYLRTIGFRRVE